MLFPFIVMIPMEGRKCVMVIKIFFLFFFILRAWPRDLSILLCCCVGLNYKKIVQALKINCVCATRQAHHKESFRLRHSSKRCQDFDATSQQNCVPRIRLQEKRKSLSKGTTEFCQIRYFWANCNSAVVMVHMDKCSKCVRWTLFTFNSLVWVSNNLSIRHPGTKINLKMSLGAQEN